jgi:hypothetical protein
MDAMVTSKTASIQARLEGKEAKKDLVDDLAAMVPSAIATSDFPRSILPLNKSTDST